MNHAYLPNRVMPAMVETCFAIGKEGSRCMILTITSERDPAVSSTDPLVPESSMEVIRGAPWIFNSFSGTLKGAVDSGRADVE